MCGGGEEKKKDEGHVSPTPTLSPTVQAMISAIGSGPAGYTSDIRRNLAMDVPMPGYTGGSRATTGMTRSPMPFNYTAKPTVYTPAVRSPAPAASESTAGTVSEADLFLSRQLPRPSSGSSTSSGAISSIDGSTGGVPVDWLGGASADSWLRGR